MDSDGKVLSDSWRMALIGSDVVQKGKWEKLIPPSGSSAPPARSGHLFISWGHMILMGWGADSDGNALDDVWLLDP